MTSRRTWWVWILLVLVAALPARADDEKAEAPSSYTPEELAALDKALHAANLTRKDLTFTKDLAKGHACLDIVKRMLHDPLTIAPVIDRTARDQRKHASRPHGGLRAATSLLLDDTELRGSEFHWGWDRIAADFKYPPSPSEHLKALTTWLAQEAAAMQKDLQARIGQGETAPRLAALRRYLPTTMAWHDVFESPYPAEREAGLEQTRDAVGDAFVHEIAAGLDTQTLVWAWLQCFGDPVASLKQLQPTAFPREKPLVKETPYGRIALGTPGDDVYSGDFAVLIDPGGNDRYVGCRIGAAYGTQKRRVGFFADLGGDDFYDCSERNITLGAAVLGLAAFLDLGAGNDRYRGGHCSMGAAMGGVAVFYDDGGTDTYEGRTFTQGAAGFGIGIFHDDSVQAEPKVTADEGTKDPVDIRLFDNDRLTAWSNAQAFARCQGIALCINTRGNDTYEAGGVYLHAPLFADRYQSFSQGFAIGERGIDYAGGIAMLIDHAGNDRYLGDIYNQGVGYWYSAGLLYDGGGNDLYEMTQYGQGSGIHLAVGGLVDESGHDTYVMHSGLGQGGSHDFAASILHDRGGNDHYMGMTSCNGCGLTNSVGLFFDRAGNDTYAGRKGSINNGRPARGFGSVGVLVDLAGKDHYLGIMEDGAAWRHSDLGVGVDLSPPSQGPVKPENTPGAGTSSGTVEIPAVCSYEGELTQAVFDELWQIAIRWEVGENRRIVPKARERLIEFGAPVLPLLDAAMEKGASGLELRAFQDVLTGVRKAGAADGVLAFLRRNLAHASERRRRVALHLVGEMKVREVEKDVVRLLEGEEEAIARRAAGVLARIESHAGDEVLLTWLKEPARELRVMAALGTLLGLESDCYGAVRPLLDHPLMNVRSRLATLLGSKHAAYATRVAQDLGAEDLSDRAVRTLLDAFARSQTEPLEATVTAARALLSHEDWGVRADAARALQHARAYESLSELKRLAIDALLAIQRQSETEPYVLFWLQQR